MVRTANVFTPAKLPTVTDVDRSLVSKRLRKVASHGGFFVSVLGSTKLGKTTLVRGYLDTLDEEKWWSTYLSGQALRNGTEPLWKQLAQKLGIPTSQESGLSASNRSSWGIASRFKASFMPGASVSVEGKLNSETGSESRATDKFDINAEVAVTDAILSLLGDGIQVVIAIDDFHFITSAETRGEIALALRPLADKGLTVILSTIHEIQVQEALANTNLGGRRKPVEVARWSKGELAQIAAKGFPHLGIAYDEAIVKRLADESFGSPQIMQQLLLNLCEDVNDLTEGEPNEHLIELSAPDSWDEFFRELEDEDAASWLKTLTRGPNPRNPRKHKPIHPGPPPKELDGYQLLMLALHELNSPTEVDFDDLKAHIGRRLDLSVPELNRLNLRTKVNNLHQIASKDTKKALEALGAQAPVTDLSATEGMDEEAADDEAAFGGLIAADAVPQPFFAVRGDEQHAEVQILDPLLAYMIKWHPEIILENGR